MKICLHVPSLEVGGAEKVVVCTANYLADTGHQVELLLGTASGPLRHLVSKRVAVRDLGTRGTTESFPALLKRLRSANIDVFVSSLPATNVASVLARSLTRHSMRLVLWEHSNLSYGSRSIKQRLIRRAALRAYQWADAIIAVSNGVAEDLIETAALQPERVHVVHNPIELHPTEESASPHVWLIDDRKWKVVITAGRLESPKNFRLLLEAMTTLPTSVRLIILGEGSQRSALEKQRDELGLRGRVELPGYVSNVSSWMRKADAFALSSTYEGFGNVIVEALGVGLPVVATDCPSGPSEILDGGRFGELVPVEDAVRLGTAIANALNREYNREVLIKRALTFDARIVLPRLEAVITGSAKPSKVSESQGDRLNYA